MEFDAGPDELTLPDGRMLVAMIYGEPSPHLGRNQRYSFLFASSCRDVVVRSSSGQTLWSERLAKPGSILSEDWGEETQAMTDVAHLMDWINPLSRDISTERVAGISENYGAYEGVIDAEHRFVLSLSVHEPTMRTLVKMIAHRVIDRDNDLLSSADVDARALRALFV